MSNASADKIDALLAKSQQVMKVAKTKRQALPPGFLDKVADLVAGYVRGARASGDVKGAETVLAKALEMMPDQPDICFEQAALLRSQEKSVAALPFLEKTLARKPKHADAHHLMGDAMLALWRLPEAVDHFAEAAALRPDNMAYRKSYARALTSAGRPVEAAVIWRDLLKDEPDNIEYLNQLTIQLIDCGEIEEARALCRVLIDKQPKSGGAHRILARTGKYTSDDPHIAEMERAIENAQDDPEAQRDIHFALYNALDSAGEYERAFFHLSTANRMLGDSKGYSTGAEVELIRRIKAVFTKDFVSGIKRSTSKESPIFIVGLPRSGSTLTEQILASHPDVGGAGEVMVLQDILQRELFNNDLRNIKRDPFDADFRNLQGSLSATTVEKLDRMAAEYMHCLRGLAQSSGRVTDKYLSNFLWIGFIWLMFPNARIVHCRRNALANSFSIFSSYFPGDGLKYKARLEDIGYVLLARNDLMRHWNTLFPGFFYDLSYEALTENQEEETRKLLDYCGLEWNPACLSFHKTKRAVKTASFNQVRQAMYSGVDKKTANYIDWLRPLVDILEMDPENTRTVAPQRASA